MLLTVDKCSAIPVYRQIVEQVRSMVASAQLPVGASLPTVRALAADLDVSRLTVHKAYQELQEIGLIVSRRRHGTTVTTIKDEETGLRRLAGFLETGPFSDFEQICERTNVRSLASPVPDPRLFDVDEFLSCHNVLRGEDNWSHYYPSEMGDEPLAKVFQSRLKPHGVECSPESFVPLSGRNPAMVVLANGLFTKGRPVAVQEPHALGIKQWYESQGVKSIGVPSGKHGIDTEALERACRDDNANVLVGLPNFGLIDGLGWPDSNRREVARILAKYGVTFIERAGNSILSFEQVEQTPMGTFLPKGTAFVACSLQMALAPGLDMAFVASNGPRPLWLEQEVARSGLLMSRPTRLVSAEFMRRAFDPILARIVRTYQSRRDALVSALGGSLPDGCTFEVPQGGFCLYVRLPRPVDPEQLFRRALQSKVALMPGRYVSASGTGDDGIALSYSMLDPAALTKAGETVGRVLKTVL